MKRAWLCLALVVPSVTWACGWSEEPPLFAFETRPEEWKGYLAGDLGILRGKLAPDALVVAYRVLIESPLTSDERKAMEARFAQAPEVAYVDALSEWRKARGIHVSFDGPRVSAYRQSTVQADAVGWTLNCNDDAFLTAAATLRARQQPYTSNELVAWIVAQDAVFSNCAGVERTIPPPLTAGSPLVQRDRAYQIAAAHFYAGDYDVAAAAFHAIAQDAGSPWQPLGSYLEARALVRKALLSKVEGRDLPALEAALKVLRAKVAAQPKDANLARLFAYAQVRARPAERAAALADGFLKTLARPELGQELIDFEFALGHPVPTDRSTAASDLADWVCVMSPQCGMGEREGLGEEADLLARAGVAAEKWKQTHAAHWLLAALLRAAPRQADVPVLLAAAERVPASWPGAKTVRLEQARLLTGLQRFDEARAALDRIAATTPAQANLVRQLRLEAPRDAAELISAAERVPVELPGTGPCFDARGADLVNHAVPSATLAVAVEAKPDRLLATVAFVRAALLDDETTARALLPFARAASPELDAKLSVWASAKEKDARAFAIAHLLLTHRGLGPNVPHDYCAPTDAKLPISFQESAWCSTAESAPLPAYLTGAEREAALRERASLDALGTGLDHLTRVATAWARAHPEDPRSAEALSLAVKRARNHPCATDGSAKLSRAAFRLLHGRFAQTEAAKATPYWY